MQLALHGKLSGFRRRLRLPDVVPPFSDRVYYVYRIIWFAALALALIGPIAGIYARLAAPSNDSGLMLGSRVGIAVAEEDATRIRFPIGAETPALGIRPGDDIVAVDGLELPAVVPFSDRDLAKHGDEPAYILLSNLFYGTGEWPAQLTIKSPDGKLRTVPVMTGEQHIAAGADAMHIPRGFLGFVDLLHVVTYPFLLVAAWFLHKRQPRDPVSSILSIAILLTMTAEQPSATFLSEMIRLPRPAHLFLYDMGNICLLAGILLFPHGKLSPRLLLVLAALPALLFLHGDAYRGLFIIFMILAVLMLISCLRAMADGDVRQQIKWALFGFSGYAIFLATSLICDMIKPQAGSFATQIILEMSAGLALGVAFLSIQLGLLVALLRFRLYDAEFVISRSATFAGLALVTGAAVAGVIQGLGTWIQNTFGSNAGAGAAGLGAAMATALISPAYSRINQWMERRFQKDLLELRARLPETVRDLREVAPLDELLNEVLVRVQAGVQTVRSAVIVNGAVEEVLGITSDEATLWLNGFNADPEKKLCDSTDAVFRVRVPLIVHGQKQIGWLVVGPRPDGTTIRDDEQEAMVGIADPIARAIGIVLKRDLEQRQLHDILSDLGRRLDDVEAHLHGPKLQAQG
ncbi:MAG: hypothetical protein JWN69_15 [Alphaproteobacteria bacterium]|nr:hypothetical protein [Alphaproteobacteria bacterium]